MNLIYSSLASEKQNWKALGKGIRSVTVQTFTKWAVHILYNTMDGKWMPQIA